MWVYSHTFSMSDKQIIRKPKQKFQNEMKYLRGFSDQLISIHFILNDYSTAGRIFPRATINDRSERTLYTR